VKDLQRDLEKVLGKASPVYHSLDEAGNQAAIVIVSPESEIAAGKSRYVQGTEAHRVFVEPSAHIVLQGSDMRGSIYALYTFSEKILGIPPLWYWGSWEAGRQTSIEVALSTDFVYDSPYVQYRSWFPNDQSRYTNWRKLAADHDRAWAEAMMRLKLNTIVLDNIISGEQLTKEARIAKDYGMIAASTHISPLGARIPESAHNRIATIDQMFRMWSDNIDKIQDQKLEVVWTLAFRGHRDVPFWETFHDAPSSDKERAAIIQEMLGRQLNLLRSKYGDKPFAVRTTLYNEVSDYYAAGLLQLPDDPNLIYNFVAARRDHYPPDGIRGTNFGNQPLGYYMNFQFTSTGSHFAQAEGPWKMQANYRMIDARSTGPLVFAEGNMGNIREHLLEGSALASMMWHWDAYNTDDFVREFAKQYFGSEYGERAAELYKSFLDSYWEQKHRTIEGFERQFIVQDLRYLRIIQDIFNDRDESNFDNESWYRIVPSDNGAQGAFEAIQNGTSASIAKLEQVVAKADQLYSEMPKQGRLFFNDLMRTQAHFMLGLNQALYNVVRHKLIEQSNPALAREYLLEAQKGIDRLFMALAEQDHGVFQAWNSGLSKDSLHSRLLEIGKAGILTQLRRLEERNVDPAYSVNDLHLYLFIGQSNMAGRAPIEEEDKGPIERAYLLNNNEQWEPAQTGEYGSRGYQGFNRYSTVEVASKKNGLNPALPFAKVITERMPHARIGIISNAVGDTNIAKWQKGAGTYFFEEAVRRTKCAMEQGQLMGILWHQGEADRNNDRYLQQLLQLAADLRSELGVRADEVPFVAGQLLPGAKYEHFNTKIIVEIAHSVPNSDYVISDGTSSIGDDTHFSAEGQRILGKRYAFKMLEMMSKQ
jgi:hypothetical protein